MSLIFGPYTLVEQQSSVLGPDGPIELGGRSFDLLVTLLRQPNELVSKSDLLDAAWPGIAVEENTLQVHMSALRKALGQGYIATVHGRGYRYVGPPPRSAPELDRTLPGDGNLNLYRVTCVERDAERRAIGDLLREYRLVTIQGPGGVGKTTLALAIASDVAEAFKDGVWVVDLAPLSEANLVESAVIQTLGVPFRQNLPPVRAIVEAIEGSQLLILFDNCEHVAAAVARVADEVLAGAPGVKILSTSQVPLTVPDERLFKLAPFAVSEGGTAQSEQFFAHCYEVLGETLTAADQAAVRQLCRRLDGVALALKMAASRAATLGIAAVDRQIEQHIAGLSASWKPGLERHHSLEASLQWSYQLLSEADRQTLRCLSVFQGSFTLEGAMAVAGLDSDQSVSELIARSMIVRDGQGGSRYRLLESTRHFALVKLKDAGDEDGTRKRHAEHVLTVFEAALDRWEVVPDRQWLVALQPDTDNLRAALEWTRSKQEWPTHVGLAACSYRFWIENQLPGEGLAFAEAARANAHRASDGTEALLGLALAEYYRLYRLDYRSLDRLQVARAFFEASDDLPKRVQTLMLEGWSHTVLGDNDAARVAFSEMDELAASIPSSKVKARALVLGAVHKWLDGDKLMGRTKLEAGLAMHQATGNLRAYWKSVMLSAEIMHQMGDTSDAIDLVLRVVPDLRLHANAQEHAGQIDNLCVYYMSIDDYEAARPLVAECASRMPRDDKNGMWCIFQNASELLAHDGDLETAALLLGFVDSGFASWEDGRQGTEKRQRDRIIGLLEAGGLPPAQQKRLFEQGGRLSMFEVEVLSGLNKPMST